jgi:hypothetical protein
MASNRRRCVLGPHSLTARFAGKATALKAGQFGELVKVVYLCGGSFYPLLR